MKELVKRDLGKGIVNIPSDPEKIPPNAAQDSLGWISTDGHIELARGKTEIGTEYTTGGSNPVYGFGYGYKKDGTIIYFRKVRGVIQVSTGGAWSDLISGLTVSSPVSFSRYQSPAGNFVFITGDSGIYKVHTSFTASSSDVCVLNNSSTNYEAFKSGQRSTIFNSRMFSWNNVSDKTALYLSYVDKQDSTVYTTVTAEVIAAASSGTLAFKSGSARRNCFAVVFTIGAQTFTDNYDGTLTGSSGGTGTINYATGAWTLSVSTGGTCTYSWEDSSVKGIADFSFSGTRTAGQGNIFRQDIGGDQIQSVEMYDGKYYSIKEKSVYELDISSTSPYIDLDATNKVFRKDAGMQSFKASVSSSIGIVFMDSSSSYRPMLTILEKNVYGDNLVPKTIANHFDFSKYVWDDCSMSLYGEYIVFSGRTSTSSTNDKLFLYHLKNDTVDILSLSAKYVLGVSPNLFIGSPTIGSVYKILYSFTDNGSAITNSWISNDELFGTDTLKKVKKLRLKGLIQSGQKIEIYTSYDNAAYVLAGTILQSGTYVDSTATASISNVGVGSTMVGENSLSNAYFYLAEIKIPTKKIRKLKLKITATGTGYVSVDVLDYFGISYFNQKLPSQYRTKQNVNAAGTATDQ